MEQATIEEDKVHVETKTEIREEIRKMRHKVFMLPC